MLAQASNTVRLTSPHRPKAASVSPQLVALKVERMAKASCGSAKLSAN